MSTEAELDNDVEGGVHDRGRRRLSEYTDLLNSPCENMADRLFLHRCPCRLDAPELDVDAEVDELLEDDVVVVVEMDAENGCKRKEK